MRRSRPLIAMVILVLALFSAPRGFGAPLITEDRETRVLPVRYMELRLERLPAVIRLLFPALHCDIYVDKANQVLILRGTPEDIQKLENFVKSIDVPERNVRFEVKLFSINARAACTLDLVKDESESHDRSISPRPQRVYQVGSNDEFHLASNVNTDALAAEEKQGNAICIAHSQGLARPFHNPAYFRFGGRIPTTYYDLGQADLEVALLVAEVHISADGSIRDDGLIDCVIHGELDILAICSVPQTQFVCRDDHVEKVQLKNGQPVYLSIPRRRADPKTADYLTKFPVLGKFFSDDTSRFLLISVTPWILP